MSLLARLRKKLCGMFPPNDPPSVPYGPPLMFLDRLMAAERDRDRDTKALDRLAKKCARAIGTGGSSRESAIRRYLGYAYRRGIRFSENQQ